MPIPNKGVDATETNLIKAVELHMEIISKALKAKDFFKAEDHARSVHELTAMLHKPELIDRIELPSETQIIRGMRRFPKD